MNYLENVKAMSKRTDRRPKPHFLCLYVRDIAALL